MFDDTILGKILVIADGSSGYGSGYKRFKLRSEDGNSERYVYLTKEQARGFGKGDWILYRTDGNPSIPLVMQISPLVHSDNYGNAECCENCGDYRTRTMFSPGYCSYQKTSVERFKTCDHFNGM